MQDLIWIDLAARLTLSFCFQTLALRCTTWVSSDCVLSLRTEQLRSEVQTQRAPRRTAHGGRHADPCVHPQGGFQRHIQWVEQRLPRASLSDEDGCPRCSGAFFTPGSCPAMVMSIPLIEHWMFSQRALTTGSRSDAKKLSRRGNAASKIESTTSSG